MCDEAPAVSRFRYIDARHLQGGGACLHHFDVREEAGPRIGWLDGVIVDVDSQRVRYFVLHSGTGLATQWQVSRAFPRSALIAIEKAIEALTSGEADLAVGAVLDAASLAFTATGIRLAEMTGIRYHPDDPARNDLDLQARALGSGAIDADKLAAIIIKAYDPKHRIGGLGFEFGREI
jgi:hypothetical protein